MNYKQIAYQKLSEYLQNLDQESETKELEDCAAGLVQIPLIKHKDKEVKVLTACCLADIIRVFAPDAPYSDDQLKVFYNFLNSHQDVFRLFVQQLNGLDDPGSPMFARYYALLEKISIVKAFVLVVDIDEPIIIDLFKTFFNVLK